MCENKTTYTEGTLRPRRLKLYTCERLLPEAPPDIAHLLAGSAADHVVLNDWLHDNGNEWADDVRGLVQCGFLDELQQAMAESFGMAVDRVKALHKAICDAHEEFVVNGSVTVPLHRLHINGAHLQQLLSDNIELTPSEATPRPSKRPDHPNPQRRRRRWPKPT